MAFVKSLCVPPPKSLAAFVPLPPLLLCCGCRSVRWVERFGWFGWVWCFPLPDNVAAPFGCPCGDPQQSQAGASEKRGGGQFGIARSFTGQITAMGGAVSWAGWVIRSISHRRNVSACHDRTRNATAATISRP